MFTLTPTPANDRITRNSSLGSPATLGCLRIGGAPFSLGACNGDA